MLTSCADIDSLANEIVNMVNNNLLYKENLVVTIIDYDLNNDILAKNK
jgi:hypothetical protein